MKRLVLLLQILCVRYSSISAFSPPHVNVKPTHQISTSPLHKSSLAPSSPLRSAYHHEHRQTHVGIGNGSHSIASDWKARRRPLHSHYSNANSHIQPTATTTTSHIFPSSYLQIQQSLSHGHRRRHYKYSSAHSYANHDKYYNRSLPSQTSLHSSNTNLEEEETINGEELANGETKPNGQTSNSNSKSSSSSSTTSSSLTSTNPKPIIKMTPSTTSSLLDQDFSVAYLLISSAIIGVLSGCAVSLFKLSVETVRAFYYGTDGAGNGVVSDLHIPIFLIPAIGGVGVSLLAFFGDFAPGLRGAVEETDEISLELARRDPSKPSPYTAEERIGGVLKYLQKPMAAISTLGSGCSLGPEGPSVEVGMSLSRLCMFFTPSVFVNESNMDAASQIRRNRLLLSAGAAAGVSAGFNAPLSGVFFALEIVQQAQLPLELEAMVSSSNGSGSSKDKDSNSNEGQNSELIQEVEQENLTSSGSITAILIASVLSALIAEVFLGKELALSLPVYNLKTPLIELPLYLLLGVISGVVASTFSGLAQFSKSVFDGEAGPESVQSIMKALPSFYKPIIGGLTCGVIGIAYPQILFFGYETLNSLLVEETLPTELLLSLLFVKTFTTAVSAGSGLVGGTFAPSVFLGGMVGASFHNIAEFSLHTNLADIPVYTMVGAASVLAALFRAPLTASLLLFELTRDYDVILPLMASSGVASLIGDVVEKALKEKRRGLDSVSWGDLSDDEDDFKSKKDS